MIPLLVDHVAIIVNCGKSKFGTNDDFELEFLMDVMVMYLKILTLF